MTNIIITVETDSMTKTGHMMRVKVMKGTTRTSQVGTTSEILGVEVIERTLRIETSHMTQVEAGIYMILEDLEGAKERVDQEIEIGLTLEIEVRKDCVIAAEN